MGKKILTNNDIKLTLEKKLVPVLKYLYESKNRVNDANLSKWHRKLSEKLKEKNFARNRFYKERSNKNCRKNFKNLS